MNLRLSIARRVAAQDAYGNIRPPGGIVGIVLTEPNGATTAVLSKGDAMEIAHGRDELLMFSTTPTNVLKIAWFVLWTWWVKATWCGIKLRLWRWALPDPVTVSKPVEPTAFRSTKFRTSVSQPRT